MNKNVVSDFKNTLANTETKLIELYVPNKQCRINIYWLFNLFALSKYHDCYFYGVGFVGQVV